VPVWRRTAIRRPRAAALRNGRGGHDERNGEAPTEGYDLDARADEIERRIEAVASLAETQRDDIDGMVESLGELSVADEAAASE
jgi:hypothetical protein